MSTPVAVLVFSIITVLAGVGVVLTVPVAEKRAAAQVFTAWTLGVWAFVGVLYLLGWWTP